MTGTWSRQSRPVCWGNAVSNQDQAFGIFGVGQGMVDYTFPVTDDDLAQLRVPKGGRRTVNSEQIKEILDNLHQRTTNVVQGTGGGSLNNTLVCLSVLRQAHEEQHQRQRLVPFTPALCNMTFVGLVSKQFYSQYYPGQNVLLGGHITTVEPWQEPPYSSAASSPIRAGLVGSTSDDSDGEVAVCNAEKLSVGSGLSTPISGTVLVLVTPDGQRSFLSDPQFGLDAFTVTEEMRERLCRSSWLLIEGYLLEHPKMRKKLATLCEIARAAGVRVGLSTGDVSIVRSAAEGFREILGQTRAVGGPFVDVLFANLTEATALVEVLLGGGATGQLGPGAVAVSLSQFARVAVVTDGENGSDVAVAGGLEQPVMHVHVDAVATKLVETCGAGDAYAAGLMYAWHVLETRPGGAPMGVDDWEKVAAFASRLAAVVVNQPGTAPPRDSIVVRKLVATLVEGGAVGSLSTAGGATGKACSQYQLPGGSRGDLQQQQQQSRQVAQQ